MIVKVPDDLVEGKSPDTLKHNIFIVFKYTISITIGVLFVWFMTILMTDLSYKYLYQDLVKTTIKNTVKPEYLKEYNKFSLIDPEKLKKENEKIK